MNYVRTIDFCGIMKIVKSQMWKIIMGNIITVHSLIFSQSIKISFEVEEPWGPKSVERSIVNMRTPTREMILLPSVNLL